MTRPPDSGADAVRVDYERFLRRGTRTALRVRMRTTSPGRPGLGLRLAQPYFEGMRLESVFPAPRQVRAGRDHVTFEFDQDARQPGPLTVTIVVVPHGIGFRQWVYP